ncbi:hypothetical protein ACFQ0B_06325 [Nonomuraea thailandensis]
MEFQGWSDGLALRPRDYLGKGQTLAAAVRTAGPLGDEALHLFALGSAAAMARLHLGGIAGLRLSPGNVMIGPRGQVFLAPGRATASSPPTTSRTGPAWSCSRRRAASPTTGPTSTGCFPRCAR